MCDRRTLQLPCEPGSVALGRQFVAEMLGALESTAGRGVPIVATLAERWGQRPYDGRTKDVWAEFAVPPTSLLSVRCRREVR